VTPPLYLPLYFPHCPTLLDDGNTEGDRGDELRGTPPLYLPLCLHCPTLLDDGNTEGDRGEESPLTPAIGLVQYNTIVILY
jgi:hypothetical protein